MIKYKILSLTFQVEIALYGIECPYGFIDGLTFHSNPCLIDDRM